MCQERKIKKKKTWASGTGVNVMRLTYVLADDSIDYCCKIYMGGTIVRETTRS